MPLTEPQMENMPLSSWEPTFVFAPIGGLTVGEFRAWLLAYQRFINAISGTDTRDGGHRLQDHAQSGFNRRGTSLPGRHSFQQHHWFASGRLSTLLQPNHPTGNPCGIAASILDSLLYDSGDAIMGINPTTDHLDNVNILLNLLDEIINHYNIPMQSCVLTHVITSMELMRRGAPVDLVFSIHCRY